MVWANRKILKNTYFIENKPVCSFTQLVWKESTQLGVGVVKSSWTSVYVVANYQTQGSVISLFPMNVFNLKLDEEMKKQLEDQQEKEE